MDPYPPVRPPSRLPPPYYRPEKNYLAEALLTLLLYYLGFGVVGLVANIIFLNNANRDEVRGIYVQNKGCLQAMLWVHVAGLVLGCLIIGIILLLGGFGALTGLLSGSGNP